jgi:hypothetical protein
MVLIRITPTWAKIIDFETRFPTYVEELMKARRVLSKAPCWPGA